jgi:hypothetical protein
MANTIKSSKIFRYKLSDDILLNITQFAKIHQFDDRHMYKDAWLIWLAEHQDSVEREVARLEQLDYKGDSIDKMFKAGRYYFREKVATKAAQVEQEQVEQQQVEQQQVEQQQVPNVQEVPKVQIQTKAKRDYIVMHPDTIQAMDKHLRSLMTSKEFKPALAYNQFCEQHEEILRKEIRRLLTENETLTGVKLSAKLKKTYKNRYFILHRA